MSSPKTDDELRSAFKTLYGVTPEDQSFRNVVSSAMEHGYLRRVDGKPWGATDQDFEIHWVEFKEPVLSSVEIKDSSGHSTSVAKARIWYGGMDSDGSRIRVYEGKAVVNVPWSRVRHVDILGEATELGADWHSSGGRRPVHAEVTTNDGHSQIVLLVAGDVIGARPLGSYSLALKEVSRLVPTVELPSLPQ